MIQVRAGASDERAKMLLNMCFPCGLDAAIRAGNGKVVALRITERAEET